MKKINCVFLLVILLFCYTTAYAEQPSITIQALFEQSQAGWHQSYNTKRGETIDVNINISVPNVMTFACYYAVDTEMVQDIPLTKNRDVEIGEGAYYNEQGFFSYDWPNHATTRGWQKTAEKNGTAFTTRGEPRALLCRFGQFDMNIPYAVNNTTTMATSLDMMNECLKQYFPTQNIALQPHWLHAHVEPGRYKKIKNMATMSLLKRVQIFKVVYSHILIS